MWSPELIQVRDQFRAIGDRHASNVQETWFESRFPFDLWRDLADAGFQSAIMSDRGGVEVGMPWMAAAIEGLTYSTLDGGFVITLMVHSMLGVNTIDRLGSAEARNKYLPSMADGSSILAFAVTERHGGSDAYNPKTLLRTEANGEITLSGGKWHITNAPQASVILALARDEASGQLAQIIVERDWPGVEIGEALSLAGAKTSPVAEIRFDHVPIPPENVIRLGATGVAVTRRSFDAEKILASFGALGILDRVITIALDFVRNRSVAGVPLSTRQYLQHRLTDAEISAFAIRSMAHAALTGYVAGRSVSLEAASTKYFAIDRGINAIIDLIKCCGSYGLQKDQFLYPVLLDALCGSIGGGTEEAQRLIVFGEMTKRRGRHSRRSEATQSLPLFSPTASARRNGKPSSQTTTPPVTETLARPENAEHQGREWESELNPRFGFPAPELSLSKSPA